MFGIGQLLKEFLMFPLHVLQSLKIIIDMKKLIATKNIILKNVLLVTLVKRLKG
jgi:hypothetical protein